MRHDAQAGPEGSQTTVQSFIAQLQPRAWNRWDRLSPNSETGQTINDLLNDRWNLPRFFDWPPDVFALTSLLLENTGAYRAVITPPDPERMWPPAGWADNCRKIAGLWRAWLSGDPQHAHTGDESHPMEKYRNTIERYAPRVLVNDLYDIDQVLREQSGNPIASDAWELARCLLAVHAIADETMRGVGTLSSPQVSLAYTDPRNPPELKPSGVSRLHLRANLLLALRGTLSRVGKHRGLVLPKMRASQVGLTLRSLSHHLSFHQSEVDVAWRAIPWVNTVENTVNALIVPWPYVVDAQDFQPDTPPAFEELGHARYFAYHPVDDAPGSSSDRNGRKLSVVLSPRGERLRSHEFRAQDVVRCIESATAEHSQVHLLVFPESSLRREQLITLQNALVERFPRSDQLPVLITGVSHGTRTAGETPFNRVVLSFYYAGKWFNMQQDKHHRWKLDPRQISEYSLGGVLSGARSRWEATPLPRRRLSFLTSNAWLTLAPLICEDLARLDPVSDVIRGVGPTLVVALLFDGPQLKTRWPARYAGVFADDPGSSVLTVTALGMSNRWAPAGRSPEEDAKTRAEVNSTVALWRDPIHGWQEIKMRDVASPPVLTVATHFGEEDTADMRRERDSATFSYQSTQIPPSIDQIGPADVRRDDPPSPPAAAGSTLNEPAVGNVPSPTSDLPPVPVTDDRRRSSQTAAEDFHAGLVDLCELTLYTFYVDALVDIGGHHPPEEPDALLAWMHEAVGIGTDGDVPRHDDEEPHVPDAEILALLRYSAFHRRSIPLDVPTPQLLLALDAARDLVQRARAKLDAEAGGTTLSAWMAALVSCASADILERTRVMQAQLATPPSRDEASERDMRRMCARATKLARNKRKLDEGRLKEYPYSAKRAAKNAGLSRAEAGRLMFACPLSILWAVHNRLLIVRRAGRLSRNDANTLDLARRWLRDDLYHDAFTGWYKNAKASRAAGAGRARPDSGAPS